jgi:acetylornithine deacetylase/succinyl-diaminopimelate desuccinylase-like protein
MAGPRQSACIRYTRDYVSIPSVNPMGRTDLDPAVAGERRYAEHLRAQLRALGLDAELVGDSERPSLVAEARVADAGETVLIASHLDTVPVDGMEIDPFDPRLADGRVSGRGSCDTKSGMAALVAALERVLAHKRLRRNLVLVGEADEELGSTGVRDVIAHLGAQRPDWVIATEPTELRCVTRHKGIVHAQLRATGVACHSSEPARGKSAIVALSRAVLALDELAAELGTRVDPHLGPATLSVGRFGGGSATNIVPDDAWLVLDRRLLPDEDDESVRAELEGALAKHDLPDVRVEWCSLEKAPLATPSDDPSVRALQAALAEAGLETTPSSVAFGTDAGEFSARGWPGIVFGPGSIAQAHTKDEWVAVEQVEAASAVFERLLSNRG